MDLLEFGFGIEYTESPHSYIAPRNGRLEENVSLTDFYLTCEFTDAELRLLIENLEGLSSWYFGSHMKHMAKMPEEQADNQQTFPNICNSDKYDDVAIIGWTVSVP